MFDNSEEDKDLASQVSKSSSAEASDGPPPRAPSPPPRGARKADDTATTTKADENVTKDTPAETKTEVAGEAAKKE